MAFLPGSMTAAPPLEPLRYALLMMKTEYLHMNDFACETSMGGASSAVCSPAMAPVSGAYLDYAAATPMDSAVLDAMLPYLTSRFHNPSAPYAAARAVRADYETARATLARLIGARPACVTITAGATEANNLAFASVGAWRGRTGAGSPQAHPAGAVEEPEPPHVVTLATEHESVLACARACGDATLVDVGRDGRVDPTSIAEALTPRTELVSVSLANGELGCVQPVSDIARVVAAERTRRLETGDPRPIWLHVDASQAAAYLSVNVASLGADLLTLSAAKVYGPKQVGLLWAREDVCLRPLVRGGGQEGGLRSGTENVAGAIGFAQALELACERRSSEARRVAGLRDVLQRRLTQTFPWMLVWGPRKPKGRLPSHLSLSFPGLEARRLVILLEDAGVCVGTGSACAASRMERSHVLEAIGLTAEEADGSLRISLGHPTTEAEIDYAAGAIEDAVRRECARLGVDPATGERAGAAGRALGVCACEASGQGATGEGARTAALGVASRVTGVADVENQGDAGKGALR